MLIRRRSQFLPKINLWVSLRTIYETFTIRKNKLKQLETIKTKILKTDSPMSQCIDPNDKDAKVMVPKGIYDKYNAELKKLKIRHKKTT
jgi:hypothetical protein